VRVEVAFARPDEQVLLELELAAGATVRDAVRASGLVERFPEIDPDEGPFGIFSRACGPGRVLRAGDRVEIYRPLQVDPKEARRLRAARRKT
jgi:putative ubiquitin-RnfH superfamily antitoxin RatB of RatAB toxin-antitoxin module